MSDSPNPLAAVQNVITALESVDKPMLRSKKFVGFMVIQVCWTALLFYGIYTDIADSVQLSMVAALGTAQAAFLGAQAWHDKHVKGAKMLAMNGSVTRAVSAVSEASHEP